MELIILERLQLLEYHGATLFSVFSTVGFLLDFLLEFLLEKNRIKSNFSLPLCRIY